METVNTTTTENQTECLICCQTTVAFANLCITQHRVCLSCLMKLLLQRQDLKCPYCCAAVDLSIAHHMTLQQATLNMDDDHRIMITVTKEGEQIHYNIEFIEYLGHVNPFTLDQKENAIHTLMLKIINQLLIDDIFILTWSRYNLKFVYSREELLLRVYVMASNNRRQALEFLQGALLQ